MRIRAVKLKITVVTLVQLTLLFLMFTFTIPSPSHAAIFFDSDFETCTASTGNDFPCEGWDDSGNERIGIPPNIQSGLAVIQSSVAAFTGTKGVRGIHDNKGTPGVNGGNTHRPSIVKALPGGLKHIFARWVFREAAGFEFCAINGSTKLVRILGNGHPKIWLINYNGFYGVVAEGPYDSLGGTDLFHTGVRVSTSVWQQIEFELKLNTPGQANGLIRLWIDGRLVLERLNRQWVGPLPTSTGLHHPGLTPSNLTITTAQVYMQCGLGTMYYDRIAVGNTRIGLVTGHPSSDTTPPAIPSGVQ